MSVFLVLLDELTLCTLQLSDLMLQQRDYLLRVNTDWLPACISLKSFYFIFCLNSTPFCTLLDCLEVFLE